MKRRPPRSTRTATLLPYTSLCRSDGGVAAAARQVAGEQRDLEGTGRLEDLDVPGRRFPRHGPLEAGLALVDDVGMPACLDEGDLPGRQRLIGDTERTDRKSTRLNSSH